MLSGRDHLRESGSAGLSCIELRVGLAPRGSCANDGLIKGGINGPGKEHAVAAAHDGPATPVHVIREANARAKIGLHVIQLKCLRNSQIGKRLPGKAFILPANTQREAETASRFPLVLGEQGVIAGRKG